MRTRSFKLVKTKRSYMILSLLIPTIPERCDMLNTLLKDLNGQIHGREVEIIRCSDKKILSVGAKRNALLERALGKYCAFIDDDDIVCHNYIDLILDALKYSPDCCSLKGLITTDGVNAKTFIHSIKYNNYFEKDGIYYRPPNHLNVIKTEIAKQFKFPEKNFGEDTDWAMQICHSGLLKHEIWIEPVLYYYKYISKK